MVTPIENLLRDLAALRRELLRAARISALDLLYEREFDGQQARAEQAEAGFGLVCQLDELLERRYGLRPAKVGWLRDGQFDDDQATARAHRPVDACLAAVESQPLFSAVRPLVESVAAYLARRGPLRDLKLQPLDDRASSLAQRVWRGPPTVSLPTLFEASYSLLERPLPRFGASVDEAAPYFWTLSIQESLAADLCALSIVEYDGLPLEFYRDMAKQMADETRHARFFLLAGRSLLSESSHSRAQTLGQSAPLPIPREGNFYEAILNADLVERLVLMHHDSEAPGVAGMKRMRDSAFVSARPDLRNGIEVVRRDEVTHAKLGATWLRTLVPNARDRDAAIRNTRLMRSILLLTSCVGSSGNSLSVLVARFSEGAELPHLGFGAA